MRRARPLLLFLALGACSLVDRPPIEPTFGAPYEIVVGAAAEEAMNRPTPLLVAAGRLVVVVEYQGGCSDHDFRLDYALDAAEARVWITHDDPGDPCSEVQREALSFALGEAVLGRPSVVLLDPDGPRLPVQRNGVPLG